MMKYIRMIIAIMAVLGMANVVSAHCGSCGVGGSEGKGKEHKHHAEMKKAGHDKMGAYFKVQDALASDDLAGAQKGAEKLASHLKDKDGHAKLAEAASAVAGADNIEAARKAFHELSQGFIKMAKGSKMASELYVVKCPMAFNYEGAEWLQTDSEVKNPYFGKEMLTCGAAKKLAQK